MDLVKVCGAALILLLVLHIAPSLPVVDTELERQQEEDYAIFRSHII